MAQRTGRLLATGGLVAALCLAALLPATAWAAAGWGTQSSGTGSDLNAVTFAGASHGLAVGAAGALLFSSDGGATWTVGSSGTAHDLNAAAFSGATDAWAVGAAGTLLSSTDGGASWSGPASGTIHDLSAVTFGDAAHGYVVGAAGTLLVSTDGGATWSPGSSDTGQDLSGVAFADATDGWAVGAAGTIVHTTDGSTWAAQTSHTTQDLHAVAFTDATDGWAVGAAGTIVHTTDGGLTWAAQASGTLQDLHAVAFADAAHGWAVGAAGTIVDTTDGGLTWAVQASSAPVATDLSGLAVAADALRGSAVGAAGTMLRTLDGGVADSTFPATTATGLQATRHAGWRNQAQTVSLAASDSGSGVAAVYYTVDAGSRQTYKGAFSVSGAGSHVVSYWAVDLVGNTETAHSGYVNIDTAAPACVAVANVKVARGKLATFSYRINDPAPSCGTALVKIAIYRGHKVVKTIRLTGVAENLKRACTYRVHLANGSYTWVVTATDAAGNAQRVVGRRGLSVVTWVIHNTADVQRCLIALRYLPSGAVSGTDDYRTEQALMAYQAWNGLVRDGRDGPKTRARLEVGTSPRPRRESATGHYAEVFRSLGVLLCVNNGKLVRVVHCSTGRPSLPTPAGHFSVYMKAIAWWTTEYLDWMPYASFFHAGDAIHGFPDVPAYPASHGCVRISMPEAPWVYGFMNYGAAVIVY